MGKGPLILPENEYNQALAENVQPPGWINPEPAGCYNMVVIGAGTAGLVTAAGAAALGARVAIIERHLLGGDCLNYGCVPSKGVIRAARAIHDVRASAEFGMAEAERPAIDFAAVMRRMRRIRSEISPHDSARRFRDELGVDVFFGMGTVFSLTSLPPRLAVIGGGPIGCELAQAFARLGSKVTVIENLGHLLSREDADAAGIVQLAMVRDGIELCLRAKILRVAQRGSDKVISVEQDGTPCELSVDEILVGIGRAPNVAGLDLEAAGVAYDPKQGVRVDERLRTSNPRVFAAGDICFPYKFTHTADALARILIANALFLGIRKTSSLVVPWCTHTDPEVAHVGMYEQDAVAKGIAVTTLTIPLADVDRAALDGETEGFARVHLKKGTDTILGATIVARHAGEMINELSLAMTAGAGLAAIGRTIHPYPTQAEAIRKLADAYNRTRLTPFVTKALGAWLKWQRS